MKLIEFLIKDLLEQMDEMIKKAQVSVCIYVKIIVTVVFSLEEILIS